MVELSKALKDIKENKGPGEDGIAYEFLKNSPIIFLEKLRQVYFLFHKIYRRGEIPTSYKKSIIFPIHIQEEVWVGWLIIEGFPMVKFLRTCCWIEYMNGRVEEQNLMYEFQAGLRSYSTVDDIFMLMNVVKIKHRANTN